MMSIRSDLATNDMTRLADRLGVTLLSEAC